MTESLEDALELVRDPWGRWTLLDYNIDLRLGDDLWSPMSNTAHHLAQVLSDQMREDRS